jgi:hypothetical protein
MSEERLIRAEANPTAAIFLKRKEGWLEILKARKYTYGNLDQFSEGTVDFGIGEVNPHTKTFELAGKVHDSDHRYILKLMTGLVCDAPYEHFMAQQQVEHFTDLAELAKNDPVLSCISVQGNGLHSPVFYPEGHRLTDRDIMLLGKTRVTPPRKANNPSRDDLMAQIGTVPLSEYYSAAANILRQDTSWIEPKDKRGALARELKAYEADLLNHLYFIYVVSHPDSKGLIQHPEASINWLKRSDPDIVDRFLWDLNGFVRLSIQNTPANTNSIRNILDRNKDDERFLNAFLEFTKSHQQSEDPVMQSFFNNLFGSAYRQMLQPIQGNITLDDNGTQIDSMNFSVDQMHVFMDQIYRNASSVINSQKQIHAEILSPINLKVMISSQGKNTLHTKIQV